MKTSFYFSFDSGWIGFQPLRSALAGLSFFTFFVSLSFFAAISINSGGKLFSQTPAPAQTKNILLKNGIAHLGNGEVIENSVIGFENGKLILVANAKTIRIDKGKYDTIIDVGGKHVYPGFVSVNSTLGLTEIDEVRATRDFDDAGEINPHVRAEIAFNIESKIIPTVRSNGVLLVQSAPRGGLISGTSSVMELDGWNWEDAVYKKDDAIHLNWPSSFQQNQGHDEKINQKSAEKAKENLLFLNRFFDDAKAYAQVQGHEKKNLRFEAMRGIFDGSKSLFVHADFAKDILLAVNFAKEKSVKKMVLVGGYDSWRVTDVLRENKIPVIVRRVHDLPLRDDEDIDQPYKIPALLQRAGILFCLDVAGDMDAMNSRNLPFYAGTAAAYGLSEEQAVMSVTLNAARILGIDTATGSLETGKDATLFVSTGDALDIRTNNIELAFIRGKMVDLDNHQKTLYRKYEEKYRK